MIILLITLLIGTPVSFALGATASLSVLIFMSPIHFIQFSKIAFNQLTNMTQLIIPLFIFMAEVLTRGNIATDIYNFLYKYFRRFRSGLAISAMLASTLFAALCGSSTATAATIGRISINQMIRKGFREDFAAGVVVTGGTLGIMIPPSIQFVVYGIITENSIAKLLVAGILPGLLISSILCLFIIIRVKLNPSLVTDLEYNSFHDKEKIVTQSSFSQDKNELKAIIPPILLIIMILGFLYTGFATPTEIAGFGAVGALMIVIFMHRFSKDLIFEAFPSSVKTTTMILFLLVCGLSLSYVISYLGLASQISDLIINTGVNKWSFLIMVYILWFILGCLMDPGSMIVITVPFLYPTFMEFGFDPIWLGVVSTLCVEIGMITPPVGLNLFVTKSISDVPMQKIITGSFPFVLAMLLCLLILTFFPQIALFLPNSM